MNRLTTCYILTDMAHIHEKVDFTAEVFIVFENKVLIRKHDKYNLWLSIGGHIELDEDPNQAAVREVKEEVGLEIVLWDGNVQLWGVFHGNKQLIPPVAMNRHRINETHEHVSMIYFGRSLSDVVTIEYEGDRSDEWRWVSHEELDLLDLREDTRFYARMALEKLSS